MGIPLLDLLMFPYSLYRALTGPSRTTFELQQWAEQNDLDIVRLKRCGRPPYDVMQEFPYYFRHVFRYYELIAVDPDHVRCSGFARVRSETDPYFDMTPEIDVVWLEFEQLNWRDRPPRRSAELPDDRAEGWYADHTGAHELRWYSVGTPTDLVKDGSAESRDPAGL